MNAIGIIGIWILWMMISNIYPLLRLSIENEKWKDPFNLGIFAFVNIVSTIYFGYVLLPDLL